jgi:foldase protein PrsA
MKHAKKEAGKQAASKQRMNVTAKEPLNVRAIVLGTIGVILTIVICVVIAFEQLYQPVLLTINGDKYRLNDLRYYIFTQEYSGYQYEMMYQSYMSTSYLDQVADEDSGETNLDQMKSQVWDDIVRYEILYKEAVKQGYSVNDDDKSNAETTVSEIRENLDSSIIKANGFSESYLSKILQKMQVVSRFQEDTIDSFDIDDDAIEAEYDYEDYHQYEIGIFSADKTTTNDDGETEDLSEEDLQAAYDKLAALKDTVASTDDLDSVLGDDEETITYTSEKITKDTTTYGKKNVKKIMKMENGDVMDIIETDDKYYLIKMIDNKATESYDSAVSDAISAEEDSEFEDYYTNLEEEYTVEQNEEAWEELDFGYVTLNAYTGQAIS